MRKFLFACGLMAMVVTPALADDAASCIRRNDIRDWSSPAPHVLLIENTLRKKVSIELRGGCSGFGPYDGFAISGIVETSFSCITPGDRIVTHWAGEPGYCWVKSVAPYSGEMHPPGARHTAL